MDGYYRSPQHRLGEGVQIAAEFAAPYSPRKLAVLLPFRAMLVARGTAQAGHGINQVAEGDTWQGVGNIFLGTLGGIVPGTFKFSSGGVFPAAERVAQQEEIISQIVNRGGKLLPAETTLSAQVAPSTRSLWQATTRPRWQASPNWESMYKANIVPKMEGAATRWTVQSGKVAENVAQTAGKIGQVAQDGRLIRVTNGENIFPKADIEPYNPTHLVYGQFNQSSCAAGSCKMVMSQFGFDVPEAYIRQAIGTTVEGTLMKDIPQGLKNLGFNRNVSYLNNVSIDKISQEIQNHATPIVGVRTANNDGLHALIIDNIKNGRVYIRDPWPPGSGSAYSVPIENFSDVFTGKVILIK